MELERGSPKEIDYIKFLLLKYDRKGTLEKILDKFTDQRKHHTKTEFTDLIGNGKGDKHARDFRDKLIKEDILVKNGKRKTASNSVDTWKLDKKKLAQAFADTEYYQENRDLFVHTLKQAENKELL